MHVADAIVDQERVFGQVQEVPLAELKVEPAFDGLRSDPRFAALLERVGLPR